MKNSESGIALITMLGVMAIVTVLTASVVAISQTQRLKTATLVDTSIGIYSSESCANEAIWRILHNKKATAKIEVEEGHLQADGKLHEFEVNNRRFELRVFDLYSGISLNSLSQSHTLGFLNRHYKNQGIMLENLAIFKNSLNDYIDSDNILRNNSLEKAGYQQINLTPLPRNGLMQYREELLWIPYSEDFITPDENGVLTMINPITNNYSNNPPHLLSSPMSLIKMKANLSDTEAEFTTLALQKMRDEGLDFSSAFQGFLSLKTKLQNEFSLTESGAYTIIVKPSSSTSRQLQVSLLIGANLPASKIKLIRYQIL